eukprot:NODE_246_length_12992_cov_0.264407.p7 type:complete len:217 gc:universal NODE_246_length_12992_cov_0.264407:5014-5664(+)
MFCLILHLNNLQPEAVQQIVVYINALIAMELDVVLLICMPSRVETISTSSFAAAHAFIRKHLSDNSQGISPLDAAISIALMKLRKSTKDKRIIVISALPDNEKQYISMMNCIFSSQKLHITIDSIVLCSSIYLQQAAFITNGLYIQTTQNKLLQQLLDSIPIEGGQRLLMSKVDFRASCFCHRKMIDIGYVCSVCLSIFCKKIAACMTCKTEFIEI